MLKFQNYKPLPGACFYDARERELLAQGFEDGAAGRPCVPPGRMPRVRLCYSRGWRDGRASITPPTPYRVQLFPVPADPPRKLCAWTLANDARIRAARDLQPNPAPPSWSFAAELETDMTRTSTTRTPSAPRTIVTQEGGVRIERSARMAKATAAPVAIDTTGMNAAQKAWATRRANGWTHPGVNRAKAPAAPVEPIKRASLAAIATTGTVGLGIDPTQRVTADAVTQAAQKRAPSVIAADAEVKPRGDDKRGAPLTPRRPIRKGAPKAKPAAKPAKKAPAKKAPAKRKRA